MRRKLDGITMAVDDVGSGPPILLLHGLGLNRTIWRPLANLYKDQARFILPDLRGHGESTLGAGQENLDQYADDLLQLLDALQIEKVILGGHSMGGYIALSFAERYPERLTALAMITSNARSDTPAKRAERLRDAEDVLINGTARYARNMAERLSKSVRVIKKMEQVISATTPEGLSNVLRAIADRPERKSVLKELRQPLLIIAGKEDKIAPLEVSEEMRSLRGDSHLVVLPGVGHMPMIEAPLTVGALLLTL